jgi:outer membrane protein assembly factor BamB
MPQKTIYSIKRMYCLFLLPALTLTALSILPGCRSKSQPVLPPVETSSETKSPAVSDMPGTVRVAGIPLETLKKADLHYVWSLQLAMGRATEIKQFFYHNGQLFILTNDNVLYAFDGAKGTSNWSTSLAPAQSPFFGVQFYQDQLLFMLGRTFVEVRQSDGQILKTLDVKYPISTSAARSEDKLFVGGTNRRFYALKLKDGVEVWQNVCQDIPIGNIILTTDKVYFVTRNNMLYVSAQIERDLIWKFPAQGPVPGVLVDNNQCFLPSADTNLYCLDPQRGTLLWKFMAGGSLEELPVLTEQAIYQPVAHKSLVCLERQPNNPAGKLRWELPEGLCLLAENGSISYCMTLQKELTLMSNVTGKALLSFYVPNMDLYTRNNEDTLIFLASKSGSIVVLAPNEVERASNPAAGSTTPEPGTEGGTTAEPPAPADTTGSDTL